MRTFDTGATRDSDEGKLELWGFNSAAVEKRYGEYMHTHRVQADGKLRASDNWKKGIPLSAYKHSLSRHLNDLRLLLEGYPEMADETDLEVVLCAVKFNVDGMLFETLKANGRIRDEVKPEPKPVKTVWLDDKSYRLEYEKSMSSEWLPEDEGEDYVY